MRIENIKTKEMLEHERKLQEDKRRKESEGGSIAFRKSCSNTAKNLMRIMQYPIMPEIEGKHVIYKKNTLEFCETGASGEKKVLAFDSLGLYYSESWASGGEFLFVPHNNEVYQKKEKIKTKIPKLKRYIWLEPNLESYYNIVKSIREFSIMDSDLRSLEGRLNELT